MRHAGNKLAKRSKFCRLQQLALRGGEAGSALNHFLLEQIVRIAELVRHLQKRANERPQFDAFRNLSAYVQVSATNFGNHLAQFFKRLPELTAMDAPERNHCQQRECGKQQKQDRQPSREAAYFRVDGFEPLNLEIGEPAKRRLEPGVQRCDLVPLARVGERTIRTSEFPRSKSKKSAVQTSKMGDLGLLLREEEERNRSARANRSPHPRDFRSSKAYPKVRCRRIPKTPASCCRE